MVQFVIATHGYLANGFKSSIGVIMGQEIANRILTINAFVDEGLDGQDVKSEIAKVLGSINEEDQCIVFSDILHGSVNQMLIPYVHDEKLFVITGCNLSVMCEILASVCYSENKVDIEYLKKVTDEAKKELILVNEFVRASQVITVEDEEESFFGN